MITAVHQFYESRSHYQLTRGGSLKERRIGINARHLLIFGLRPSPNSREMKTSHLDVFCSQHVKLKYLIFPCHAFAESDDALNRREHLHVARGQECAEPFGADVDHLLLPKVIGRNTCAVVTANANANNNTGHNTFTNNWISSSNPNPGMGGPGNTISGNISISGSQISGFPAEAQTVAKAAGLEADYVDLKSGP